MDVTPDFPENPTFKAGLQAAAASQCELMDLWKLAGQNHSHPSTLLMDAATAASHKGVWEGWNKNRALQTWKGLAQWSAWHGLETQTHALIQNHPEEISKKEIARLVWLAGGMDDAPGLKTIVTGLDTQNPQKAIKAAITWQSENLETEENRKREIRKHHPDFDMQTTKWANYFAKGLESSGISIRQPEVGEPAQTNPQIRILGETHSLPETGQFLLKQIERLAKLSNPFLTVEEPEDGSWKPLMAFLTQIKRNWGKESILAAAEKFAEGDPASTNRLAAIAYARCQGVPISFIDIPRDEKIKRFKKINTDRKKRIAYGETFDPQKPETAEGGFATFAHNLLASYEGVKQRSEHMAIQIQRIAQLHPDANILHIGGSLHAQDIALALEQLSPDTGRPETKYGPHPCHPVVNLLGRTPPTTFPTKKIKGPEIG